MSDIVGQRTLNLEWYRTFLAPYQSGFPHMNRLCDEIDCLRAALTAARREERERCITKAREMVFVSHSMAATRQDFSAEYEYRARGAEDVVVAIATMGEEGVGND